MSVAEIYEADKIDPWFLARIAEIVALEDKVRSFGLPEDADNLRHAEGGRLLRRAPRRARRARRGATSPRRAQRSACAPVYKRIDTCAAEFASPTAYMYSTYEAPFAGVAACEARPIGAREDRHSRRRAEPHRPGHRIRLLLLPRLFRAERGRLRNDHDQLQSGDGLDRLRHVGSPLFRAADRRGRARNSRQGARGGDAEGRDRAVRRPDAAEARARASQQSGAPILGTSVDSIDLAEDRDRFKRLLDKLGLKQPKNGIAYSVEQARLVAGDLGLPLVVRPSYVLGGRAMAIIRDEGELDDYLLGALPSLVPADVKARYPNDKTGQINTVLGKNPLLFDRYLSDAIEVDVDALVRRQGRRRRRHHGAYRGGRHPFRRLRLLAAAALALARDDRRARGRRRASSRWRSTSAA